jgi:hypothetical protein
MGFNERPACCEQYPFRRTLWVYEFGQTLPNLAGLCEASPYPNAGQEAAISVHDNDALKWQFTAIQTAIQN